MVGTTMVTAAAALALAGVGWQDTGESAASPVVAVRPGPDGDCHRVESERFVFHSDPWINLHHFLFQWARNVPPSDPEDRRRVVAVPEEAQLETLEEGERQAWERALGLYRERLVTGDLLFDRPLIALRARLAVIGCSEAGPEEIGAELRAVLTGAMPVYRQHWWPAHHTSNKTWIASEVQALKSYEEALAQRLADAYGGEWPPERIRVDVAAYSNWAGAYTTNRPNHVTLSGANFQGVQGLEILFHEVSHASFFEQRLIGSLAAAFRRTGKEAPDRLSHVIQFVTPAEVLRSLLKLGEGRSATLIAHRMAQRGRSREQYRVVLKHWTPFLDGRIERAEALDRIAADLAEPSPR